MSKSLEELLQTKKWTGKDAGILYLYSAKNDILNARNNFRNKFAVDQNKFDKILKKISIIPKELNDFKFYLNFKLMVMDVEKLSRFYNEQLNHHILKLNSLLETIFHDRQTESKIMNLNISEEEKADIICNLDSASFQEHLFKNPDKEDVEDYISEYKISSQIIIKDIAYFYSLEFVFSHILKRYDLEFLEEIMKQQIPFYGYVNNLNKNYEKIKIYMSDKEKSIFDKIYTPINHQKLFPSNDEIPNTEEDVKISIDDLEFSTPEDIKTFVLDLSNIMIDKYLESK